MDRNYLQEASQIRDLQDPQSFQFMLTNDDFFRAYRYLFKYSETGKQSMRKNRIIFGTLAGIILFFAVMKLIAGQRFWFELIFGSALLVLMISLPERLAKANVKIRTKKAVQYPGEVYGPHTVTLVPDGVSFSSEMSSQIYYYKGIHNVYIDEYNIFLFYDFSQAVSIISTTAFPSEEAKNNFLNTLHEKISEKK